MIKNKFSYKELFKYIFLFIISFFCMAFVQTTKSYAGAPQIVRVSTVNGMTGWKIKSNTCSSWKKSGSGCSVTISAPGSGYGECPLSTSLTFNFTKNSNKFEYGSYKPTGATGSSYCRYSANVEVYNYDDTPPFRNGDSIPVLSGTCDKDSVSQGGSIICAGSAKFVGGFYNDKSGPYGTNTATTNCSPGQTCKIFATDNVGNKSNDSLSSSHVNAPYEFTVKADTTNPRVNTTITGGAKSNGYYLGNVTCTAKCTSDNLACGKSGTGSTTGAKCCATAYDKAGNHASDCADVKRDTYPPTCSHQNLSSDALINNYRMGTVYVSWKCSDSQSGCKQGTYSQSTSSNNTTSLSQTVSDKAGNTKPCPLCL